ncbi:MAG: hypothetical protein ORO03_02555 [Alphaproteobacteria bacterium]|nr:hypothetical protein [Alphaproteobacteria bacterium]
MSNVLPFRRPDSHIRMARTEIGSETQLTAKRNLLDDLVTEATPRHSLSRAQLQLVVTNDSPRPPDHPLVERRTSASQNWLRRLWLKFSP